MFLAFDDPHISNQSFEMARTNVFSVVYLCRTFFHPHRRFHHAFVCTNVVEKERLRVRETHTQRVSDEWTYFRELVFFPFSSDVYRDKKNKPRTTIIYTTEREDKIIDSESCVNVRAWYACVNMGDRLLSMFV